MIQSLQKQKQTKPILNARKDQYESQSIKQIKSQVNQLQRQIARIQDDVLKIRINSVTGRRLGTYTKVRKRAPSSSVKSRFKKPKSYRSIQSVKQKRTARNRLKSKP